MSASSADPVARFTTVYEESYGAIHAYAVRRVGAQMADEITAETFLVAWRRLDALPSEPLPYLYGIARNMVARQHTAAHRRALTEAGLTHERPRPDPIVGESTDSALWEAWQRLRPADREVLSLVAWEELPVADAARVMGCPAAVFSVRLHRARRRMEQLLSRGHAQHIPSTGLSEA
jgi:RNA polymerase sigma-70 factor, ECF subfamily